MNKNIYIIREVKKFNYILENIKTKYQQNINIEFFIKENINVNDILIIADKYFDENYEEYDNFYSFGYTEDPSGRLLLNDNKNDLIFLIQNEKKIVLKRLFG